MFLPPGFHKVDLELGEEKNADAQVTKLDGDGDDEDGKFEDASHSGNAVGDAVERWWGLVGGTVDRHWGVVR